MALQRKAVRAAARCGCAFNDQQIEGAERARPGLRPICNEPEAGLFSAVKKAGQSKERFAFRASRERSTRSTTVIPWRSAASCSSCQAPCERPPRRLMIVFSHICAQTRNITGGWLRHAPDLFAQRMRIQMEQPQNTVIDDREDPARRENARDRVRIGRFHRASRRNDGRAA